VGAVTDGEGGGSRSDRFPYYFSAAMTIIRYGFWLAGLAILLPGLEPLLALIAGQTTIFTFDAALTVSVGVNVAGAAGVVTAVRRNRKLNERVRELEGRVPPLRSQVEKLPLPKDGAG
jgi:hypothetical protein